MAHNKLECAPARCANSESLPEQKRCSMYSLTMWYWIIFKRPGIEFSICGQSPFFHVYLLNAWTCFRNLSQLLNTRSTWHWWHLQGHGFQGQGHSNVSRQRHTWGPTDRRFTVNVNVNLYSAQT